MTLTSNTPITQENAALLKAGDVVMVVAPNHGEWTGGEWPVTKVGNGWADLKHPRFGEGMFFAQELVFVRPALAKPAEGPDPELLAWAWLDRQQDEAPADIAYSADQMVDAFIAGQASQHGAFRAALEKIAADGELYRNGYCQTDIAVDPALTAQEAQDVARSALMATPTPPSVDWERVGPKLVEALVNIKAGGSWQGDAAADALAAAQPEGK